MLTPITNPQGRATHAFAAIFPPRFISIVFGAVTGLLISFGDWWIALLALVLMRRLAERRLDYVLGYIAFTLAAWPDLPVGFARQYGHDGLLMTLAGIFGLTLWGALLALPGLFLFADRADPRVHVRAVNTALAWLVLPLLIAPLVVLHPVMAAGELFPGTGTVGLLSMAVVVVLLGCVSWPYVLGGLIAIVAMSSATRDAPLPLAPQDIVTVNARHFPPFPGHPGRIEQLLALLSDVRKALDGGARIVITPELTVASADGTFEGFKEGIAHQVSTLGAVVWVGADLHIGGLHHNAMVGIGDSSDTPFVSALVPLPFILWQPWQPLPAGHASQRWRQTEVGLLSFLICYESVSTFAWIERLRGANLGFGTIAFVSSQWWAASMRPNVVLSRGAKNFARLTGSAYVSAVGR